MQTQHKQKDMHWRVTSSQKLPQTIRVKSKYN